MPITSVTKDVDAATMTVIADFAVPVERLWNAYSDPRQIEKFWGPEGWPATFLRHDMAVGGRSHYTMRGPDGEESSGYWEFLAVDPGRSFEVRDGFADGEGNENTEMPSMRMTFTFAATKTGSRLTNVTHFGTAEALEQLLGMGMEEGMRSAMGQIDAVLADLASFAASIGTEAQILSDTQVRVSRVIRGTTEQVWNAHHDADLMKRWLLGPDGWEMTECVIPAAVGDEHRTWWKPVPGADVLAEQAEGFGFDGVLLERIDGVREVSTEHMIGTDYPATQNELTLTPVDGGTLLSLVITYASAEARDAVLATGMTDGMEASYDRLEDEVFAAANGIA